MHVPQCDTVSRALRHAPAATKKGVVDLYQLQLMHVQMHVHTGIIIIIIIIIIITSSGDIQPSTVVSGQ